MTCSSRLRSPPIPKTCPHQPSTEPRRGQTLRGSALARRSAPEGEPRGAASCRRGKQPISAEAGSPLRCLATATPRESAGSAEADFPPAGAIWREPAPKRGREPPESAANRPDGWGHRPFALRYERVEHLQVRNVRVVGTGVIVEFVMPFPQSPSVAASSARNAARSTRNVPSDMEVTTIAWPPVKPIFRLRTAFRSHSTGRKGCNRPRTGDKGIKRR